MKKKLKIAGIALLFLAAGALTYVYLSGVSIPVFEPKGMIAAKQKDLFIDALILMTIVVAPVLFLTFFFAWKYRSGNTKAKYSPDFDHSTLAEVVWWGFPLLIIIVLSIMTWKSSHELDPFKPIDSGRKPLTVQVVALQWKWLFLYPEQGIATVNYVQFPEKTPIVFEITADAPMNSFWIPQLGGQIYAMPGMKTKLHLIADAEGSYRGVSANLSGKGFAGMTFTATSTTEAEFAQWVGTVQQSPVALSQEEYEKLARPSQYNPEASYVWRQPELFDEIVMKPMMEKK